MIDAASSIRSSIRRIGKIRTKTVQLSSATSEWDLSTCINMPSCPEIRQWQASFDTLLSHPYGIYVFREFLKTEYSNENIDFWLACEEFKQMTEGKRKTITRARIIYEYFIEGKGTSQINIDCKTLEITKKSLENGCTSGTFNEAQLHIQKVMEKDSYPRFLKSHFYLDLLHSFEAIPEELSTDCLSTPTRMSAFSRSFRIRNRKASYDLVVE